MNTRIVAIAVALAAGSAWADTVDMSFLGTGLGRNTQITHAGSTLNVFAGQLVHSITGLPDHLAEFEGPQATYCVDLAQHVSSSVYEFELVELGDAPVSPGLSTMGVDRAAAIRKALGALASASERPNAQDFHAAVQLVLWEIVTDWDANVGMASFDLSSGGFRAQSTSGAALSSGISGEVDFVASFLDAPGAGARTLALVNGSRQDQVLVIPSVPAMAGLGLCAALFAFPRQRSANSTREPVTVKLGNLESPYRA